MTRAKRIVDLLSESSEISLQDLEKYIWDNEKDIRKNMKTYGFKLDRIPKMKNYIDIASLLGIDSRKVKGVDLQAYTDLIYDLLSQK
jgi:hypothetical protein